MEMQQSSLPSPLPKPPKFVMDKVFPCPTGFDKGDSLLAWVAFYYDIHVKGSPPKTEQAKYRDLRKFLTYVNQEIGHDHIDSWTPAVTKHFLQSLKNTPSENTGK